MLTWKPICICVETTVPSSPNESTVVKVTGDKGSQELKVIRTCRWQRIWTQGPSDRALD